MGRSFRGENDDEDDDEDDVGRISLGLAGRGRVSTGSYGPEHENEIIL
jgi:hypothetical protein